MCETILKLIASRHFYSPTILTPIQQYFAIYEWLPKGHALCYHPLMLQSIPSARTLLDEVLERDPNLDLNSLHAEAFNLMVYYRSEYYEASVDSFLSELGLPDKLRKEIKQKMLKPVVVADKEYSNFMEEVSRRVSQAFQPISGKVAELCAEKELTNVGLIKGINYTMKRGPVDIIVYHPNVHQFTVKHTIEVKNVKLRERATRGLLYGDSLFGFFNDEGEFTERHIKEIDRLCEERGGYCYMPPATLQRLTPKGKRLRPNTMFAHDMSIFVKTGRIA